MRSVWWQQFPGDRGQWFWEDTAPLHIRTLPGSPGKGEPYRGDREALGSHHEDSQAVGVPSLRRGVSAAPATPTVFAWSVAAAPSAPPGSSMKVPRVCEPTAGSAPWPPRSCPRSCSLAGRGALAKGDTGSACQRAPPSHRGRASCSCPCRGPAPC